MRTALLIFICSAAVCFAQPTIGSAFYPPLLKPAAAGGGGGGYTDPSSIPNLAIWTVLPTSATNDNSALDYFPDTSGNGHHFRAPASGNRAIFTNSTASLNNKPSLWFDGTDDNYANSSYSLPNSDFTVFFVVRIFSKFNDPTFNPTEIMGSATTPIDLYAVGPGDFKVQSFDGANTTSGEFLEAVPMVISFVLDSSGASSRIYTNGVQVGSAGTFAKPAGGASDFLHLGSGGSGLNVYKGAFAEAALYARALTATERKNNEGYFGTKFGIPVVP